ncbi:ROK family protein, partial [Kineococcus sp. T13]|uniref:ROK family protein n=1 Tax=Kineococcus vitellinus TaxID=2696565 RepID=UPI0014130000
GGAGSAGGRGGAGGTAAQDGVDAQQVFAAARAGDPRALAAVESAGQRLTRVVVTLASLFDPELVVVAGGVAGSAEPLVEVVARELPDYLDPPRPLVAASALGRDVVVLGAVKRALDEVRSDPLRTAPAAGAAR